VKTRPKTDSMRTSLLPTFNGEAFEALVRRNTVLEASGLEHIARAAPHLVAFDSDAEFDFSVRLAIAAIATELPSSKPPKKSRS
jgi:hypothetical protein